MICQQSGTEFHFPDLDKQLCLIQQMFEKRDRSKSNASEHQQLPSADAALRPLTLNTGLSFSYPVQFLLQLFRGMSRNVLSLPLPLTHPAQTLCGSRSNLLSDWSRIPTWYSA